jgi:hypothetical protein
MSNGQSLESQQSAEESGSLVEVFIMTILYGSDEANVVVLTSTLSFLLREWFVLDCKWRFRL